MDRTQHGRCSANFCGHCTIPTMRKYAPMSSNCSGHSLAGSAAEDFHRRSTIRCSSGSTLKKKKAKLPISMDHTTTRSEVWLMRKPQDWGQPCPNPDCSHYRLINRGNISAIATYLTPEREATYLPV